MKKENGNLKKVSPLKLAGEISKAVSEKDSETESKECNHKCPSCCGADEEE